MKISVSFLWCSFFLLLTSCNNNLKSEDLMINLIQKDNEFLKSEINRLLHEHIKENNTMPEKTAPILKHCFSIESGIKKMFCALDSVALNPDSKDFVGLINECEAEIKKLVHNSPRYNPDFYKKLESEVSESLNILRESNQRPAQKHFVTLQNIILKAGYTCAIQDIKATQDILCDFGKDFPKVTCTALTTEKNQTIINVEQTNNNETRYPLTVLDIQLYPKGQPNKTVGNVYIRYPNYIGSVIVDSLKPGNYSLTGKAYIKTAAQTDSIDLDYSFTTK